MEYSKAPISEVVVGVTFDAPAFDLSALFEARQTLAADYPKLEIRSPLVNEKLVEYTLEPEQDPGRAGPFRLGLRSSDGKWLCQLQRNKLYLNWIRRDEEEVGRYVGFQEVLKRFVGLASRLHLSLNTNSRPRVSCCELTYVDRIEWERYINSISEVERIMEFSSPSIDTPLGFNNVFSRYTYKFPELGGFGILAINTATSSKGAQVLHVRNTIRGSAPDKTFDIWIKEAHRVQLSHFKRIFKKEILEKWK